MVVKVADDNVFALDVTWSVVRDEVSKFVFGVVEVTSPGMHFSSAGSHVSPLQETYVQGHFVDSKI